MKRKFALLLALALVFSLAACGGSSFQDKVVKLVDGNIAAIYLGSYDADYLDMVSNTEAECEANYLDGLEMEAEYFAYYFDIEFLDDELKAEIVDMYKEIYSHTKYTVGAASKLDDTTYAVKLTVSPINIVKLVCDDFDAGMADFFAEYENADVESFSDEEYQQYDRAWAEAIISMFYEKLPELGYEAEQTMAVQVVKNSNDIWTISNDDMSTLDTMIIYYP